MQRRYVWGMLILAGHEGGLTHFGRHQAKLDLVEGTAMELVADDTAKDFAQVRRGTRE